MPENKKIAKNTLFLYFRMLLIMGVTLYTSRVVLKTLGVEDYGLYNVVGGIVAMFTFLNSSLGGATSRFITFELGKKNYDKLNKIFNVAIVTHIAIALIIILLAETLGLYFFYEKMTIPPNRFNAAFWVYQISILTCFFSLTQVPYNATIIAHEDMKIYAYVGIVEVILKLIVVYFLSFSPIDKLIFYATLLFLIQVVVMFYFRYYCANKFSECRLKICKDKKLYKDIFSYAGADMIGNISVLVQGQGLNLLLNVFFGPVVNAARGISYQVQGAITQFSNNFMLAVRPQIIKLYADDKIEEMMKLVKDSSCFSYYLMWVISLPILLETHYILSLWLGKYPDHTVNFLHLIIILCLIQTLKTPRTAVFHATGRLKLMSLAVGGVLCMAFPLAYFFLKQGGKPESVFIAANITMFLSEFVSIIILKKYINYSAKRYLLDVHVRCIIVTAVSFVIPYLLYDKFLSSGFVRLILTCLLTTASVLTISFTLGMSQAMRNRLIGIVKTKIFR